MKINDYEILLKQIKKYKLIANILSCTGMVMEVICLCGVFEMQDTGGLGKLGEHEEYGILLMLLMIFGMLFIFLGTSIFGEKAELFKTTYVNEYRNEIVSKTLDDIFDSVAYNSGSGFSRQYIEDRDMLEFPIITDGHFYSGNYIHASYKGISWKYGDVRIWENQGRSYHPAAIPVMLLLQISRQARNRGNARTHVFFEGCVLEIAYPIPSKTRLKIYSYTFRYVKGGWTSSKREKRQETGDKNFDRRFLVKCNSDVDFRNIVTPEMKEKLELFHNLYNGFAIEIERGKLYILVAKAGQAFVPDFSQEMNVAYETKRIKREMQVITDAIDIFCRKLC